MEKYGYRFSFGPWNIHEGADPFGPPVRPARTFAEKLAVFQELGFDAVQFHDDDAVPGIDDLTPAQIVERARAMRRQIAYPGLALASLTRDPARVGVLMESAHAVLAGLDPSDEIAFALAVNRLFSVHLNDQNGLKYDQDRSFGSVDLRRAFNQVRVLDQHGY